MDFPDNEDMHACTETIYQTIYIQGKGELGRELNNALRSGHANPRIHETQRENPRTHQHTNQAAHNRCCNHP